MPTSVHLSEIGLSNEYSVVDRSIYFTSLTSLYSYEFMNRLLILFCRSRSYDELYLYSPTKFGSKLMFYYNRRAFSEYPISSIQCVASQGANAPRQAGGRENPVKGICIFRDEVEYQRSVKRKLKTLSEFDFPFPD